jgi:hypothetical protein
LIGPLSDRPSSDDLGEWLGVEVVEFGTATPLRHDEPSRLLGHAEVLRDRLTRKAEAMPRREQGTDLEKGLAVARRQFVEDEAPRLVVESTENIDHILTVSSSAAARLDQQPYRFAGAAVEHAGPRNSHEAGGELPLSLLRVRVLRRPDG